MHLRMEFDSGVGPTCLYVYCCGEQDKNYLVNVLLERQLTQLTEIKAFKILIV